MPGRSANCFAVALLLAAATVHVAGCARSEHGSIEGTLTRPDGTPLASARVVARSSETGATAYGTTDEKGSFNFGDEIAPGNYDISILEDRGDPDNRRSPTISAKYRDASTAHIRISVKPGEAAELKLTLDPP